MERFTCRTCLSIADVDETFQIFENCSSKKTIKDALLEYVPSMEETLSDKDRICNLCLSTIRNFLDFLEKCLEIEKHLRRDLISLENISYEHNIGDSQVVENIQIVLDDELKPYFDNSDTNIDNASTGTIDHDHSYIKSNYNLEDPIIKPECVDADQDCQEDPSSYQTIEQDDSFEENTSNIQFIPIETVSNQILTNNFGEASSSSQENSLGQNVTVLATGDELVEPSFVQIKEESNDSITPGSDDISFYQPLRSQSNIYICELCGYACVSHQLLQQHLVNHGEWRIMCDKCPKIFKNDSALKAHYKLKHLNTERFKCDICGQLFARADYLRNHLKRHEDDKKNNIKCRVPGKFLRFKNTEQPLPCKICGKYYNGIQKLKVHLQTHLVVKRFACEYCDLTYKRWPSLKRHEKTHLESDTFFYRCNVCWKRFVQKEELEMHMNQHGNPRYRCQVCDEQFHRKYLFDNHYLLSHATPEDIENSKKEVIYDTLLELSSQNVLVTE